MSLCDKLLTSKSTLKKIYHLCQVYFLGSHKPTYLPLMFLVFHILVSLSPYSCNQLSIHFTYFNVFYSLTRFTCPEFLEFFCSVINVACVYNQLSVGTDQNNPKFMLFINQTIYKPIRNHITKSRLMSPLHTVFTQFQIPQNFRNRCHFIISRENKQKKKDPCSLSDAKINLLIKPVYIIFKCNL